MTTDSRLGTRIEQIVHVPGAMSDWAFSGLPGSFSPTLSNDIRYCFLPATRLSCLDAYCTNGLSAAGCNLGQPWLKSITFSVLFPSVIAS